MPDVVGYGSISWNYHDWPQLMRVLLMVLRRVQTPVQFMWGRPSRQREQGSLVRKYPIHGFRMWPPHHIKAVACGIACGLSWLALCTCSSSQASRPTSETTFSAATPTCPTCSGQRFRRKYRNIQSRRGTRDAVKYDALRSEGRLLHPSHSGPLHPSKSKLSNFVLTLHHNDHCCSSSPVSFVWSAKPCPFV